MRPFADTKQAIMGKYRTLVIRRLFVILQANSRLRRGSELSARPAGTLAEQSGAITLNFWSSESKAMLALALPSRDKSHGTKLHNSQLTLNSKL